MAECANNSDWAALAAGIEALAGVALDAALAARMSRRGGTARPIRFYTPSFKAYSTSEIVSCGRSAWPAISLTGPDCALQCDHCRAKVLAPMIPARTPEELWRVANEQIARGARGLLLTGGSNRRNEVPYRPFYPMIRRIKDEHPGVRIAAHTALVDEEAARGMEQAGIDCAMMDVIGAQDTVSQVYHLRRPVGDFERSLACLSATAMKVVPHIVIGLHYGHMLGEWHALEIVARHRLDALVLVVAMPFYAPQARPFATPDAREVGAFLLEARERLPALPLLLGCARPPGAVQAAIDAYAVMAGLDGIAHPADGVVEFAVRLGREVRIAAACCSLAAGEAALALESDAGFSPEVERLIARERAERGALSGIRVVARAARCD